MYFLCISLPSSFRRKGSRLTFAVFFGIFLFSINIATATENPLYGYAWSENTGWINLAPSGSGVTINTDTGEFNGYAWGENIGWVSFNCNNTSSCGTANYKVSTALDPFRGRSSCGSCPVCSEVACPLLDKIAPIMTEIVVSGIDSKSAIITWITNENADSIVEYGIDTSYKFLAGKAGDISLPVTSHSITLLNLSPDTTYYFKIISRDYAGNIAPSNEQTFKTLPFKPEVETEPETKTPENPENPENLQLILPEEALIKNLTNDSASIFWQTDIAATSLVRLKPADSSDSQWQEIGNTSEYITDHSVTLVGLRSDVKYLYQVKSSSASGSTAISKTKDFVTNPAVIIAEVTASEITLDSAVILWKTNIPLNSTVEYGLTSNYGMTVFGNEKDYIREHGLKLKNLQSGASYHFRIKGAGEKSGEVVSDDYIFTTSALPRILDYRIESVNDSYAVVKWTSNIDTDSLVIYDNLKTEESKTQGSTETVKNHEIKITNLDSGTEYLIKIEGRDVFGNTAKGPEIKIKTLIDTIAPAITSVRTSATLMSDKEKVQTIVSWKTDEPSTSQVFVYTSDNAEKLVYSTVYDANLTTNHTIVIVELRPDTVYRLRMESVDKTGNSSLSQNFALLTPRERKSIIALIIEKLETIFGWTKKIIA